LRFSFAWLIAAWASVALVGCVFSREFDDEGAITCADDRDCPTTLECSVSHRCFRPATLLADIPGLEDDGVSLSRELVGINTPVTLTINPTRELLELPVAYAMNESKLLPFSWVSGSIANPDETFVLELVVVDNSSDGFYPVFVELIGALGGATGRLSTGKGFRVDTVAPNAALSPDNAPPSRAQPGETLDVVIIANERLKTDPVLIVRATDDGRLVREVVGSAGGGQVATSAFRSPLPTQLSPR